MALQLSIIIPLYNAEKILPTSLQKLLSTLSATPLTYEILLRDDGSSDGTNVLIQEIVQRYPEVRSFVNSTNRGLGFTLRALIEEARAEDIIYFNCDLPFGAEVIPYLVRELEKNEIVILSRYRGGKNPTRLLRKIMSRMYYMLCKILFDIRVKDIGSGTVAFRKSSVQKLGLRTEGFEIHIELFVKAQRKRQRIKEVPALTTDKGEGSFSIIRHGPPVVIQTLKLWYSLLRKDIKSFWVRYS